jgi:hypothetical protein
MEKEYTDKELEILDSFLQFEFYYKIYEKLTTKDSIYFGLFEPAWFERLALNRHSKRKRQVKRLALNSF